MERGRRLQAPYNNEKYITVNIKFLSVYLPVAGLEFGTTIFHRELLFVCHPCPKMMVEEQMGQLKFKFSCCYESYWYGRMAIRNKSMNYSFHFSTN